MLTSRRGGRSESFSEVVVVEFQKSRLKLMGFLRAELLIALFSLFFFSLNFIS